MLKFLRSESITGTIHIHGTWSDWKAAIPGLPEEETSFTMDGYDVRSKEVAYLRRGKTEAGHISVISITGYGARASLVEKDPVDTRKGECPECGRIADLYMMPDLSGLRDWACYRHRPEDLCWG